MAVSYTHLDVYKRQDLAVRYKDRNGGYTRILKMDERRGDDALMVTLKLV